MCGQAAAFAEVMQVLKDADVPLSGAASLLVQALDLAQAVQARLFPYRNSSPLMQGFDLTSS